MNFCRTVLPSSISFSEIQIINWIFYVCFFCFSPILIITKYTFVLYADDETVVPVCWTSSDLFWTRAFFLCTIAVFFFLPLATLAILYITIAKHLMANPGIAAPNSNTSALRYRRQVCAPKMISDLNHCWGERKVTSERKYDYTI